MRDPDRILLLLADRTARTLRTISTVTGLPVYRVAEICVLLRRNGLVERDGAKFRILPAGMERLFDAKARERARERA